MYQKNDCETLMNTLMPLAEQMLKELGDFYPFGATLSIDGIVSLTPMNSQGNYQDTKDVMNDLIKTHSAFAKEGCIKASGIVWNGKTQNAEGKDSDAIIISLEHRDGYAVLVGQPYKRKLFRRFVLSPIFTVEGKSEVFANQ